MFIPGDVLPNTFVEDIITIDNDGQLENAAVPIILVTEFGIVIDVNLIQLANAKLLIVSSKLLLFITRDDNLSQNLNAPTSIVLTEFGIATDVNEKQPWNALTPIIVTEEPSARDDNSRHSWNAP
jgi:hypothetical protein